MSDSFREQLRRFKERLPVSAGSLPSRPAPLQNLSVESAYAWFTENLENQTVKDARGKHIRFEARNFAYLTKLQFLNTKLKKWVDARAQVVVDQLKDKTFDPHRYRIGDISRARTMSWLRSIIESPDCIHANLKEGMSDKELYVMRYQPVDADDDGIKVVLVATDETGRVFASSFWSRQGWLQQAAKMPPLYVRLNSQGCRCRQP